MIDGDLVENFKSFQGQNETKADIKFFQNRHENWQETYLKLTWYLELKMEQNRSGSCTENFKL